MLESITLKSGFNIVDCEDEGAKLELEECDVRGTEMQRYAGHAPNCVMVETVRSVPQQIANRSG